MKRFAVLATALLCLAACGGSSPVPAASPKPVAVDQSEDELRSDAPLSLTGTNGAPIQLFPIKLEGAGTEPATPAIDTSIKIRLRLVQGLLEEGLITKDEAAEKRREILEDL